MMQQADGTDGVADAPANATANQAGERATNLATNLATNIAIIPARGGSKRIPRKNIKPFAGQPMLSYAIATAQASGLFSHIVVSTDDAEIAEVARAHGAEVPFMRPPELANDHAGVIPVVGHAITACRDLGWQFDRVCCIFACVPLLQPGDLRTSYSALQAAQAEFAFAVAEFPSSIWRALRRLPDGTVNAFYPEHTATRSQDLEPAYYDVGQFYWGSQTAWLSGNSPHHGGLAHQIEPWRAVDIDTPDDWLRAEQIYAARMSASAAGQAC